MPGGRLRPGGDCTPHTLTAQRARLAEMRSMEVYGDLWGSWCSVRRLCSSVTAEAVGIPLFTGCEGEEMISSGLWSGLPARPDSPSRVIHFGHPAIVCMWSTSRDFRTLDLERFWQESKAKSDRSGAALMAWRSGEDGGPPRHQRLVLLSGGSYGPFHRAGLAVLSRARPMRLCGRPGSTTALKWTGHDPGGEHRGFCRSAPRRRVNALVARVAGPKGDWPEGGWPRGSSPRVTGPFSGFQRGERPTSPVRAAEVPRGQHR